MREKWSKTLVKVAVPATLVDCLLSGEPVDQLAVIQVAVGLVPDPEPLVAFGLEPGEHDLELPDLPLHLGRNRVVHTMVVPAAPRRPHHRFPSTNQHPIIMGTQYSMAHDACGLGVGGGGAEKCARNGS